MKNHFDLDLDISGWPKSSQWLKIVDGSGVLLAGATSTTGVLPKNFCDGVDAPVVGYESKDYQWEPFTWIKTDATPAQWAGARILINFYVPLFYIVKYFYGDHVYLYHSDYRLLLTYKNDRRRLTAALTPTGSLSKIKEAHQFLTGMLEPLANLLNRADKSISRANAPVGTFTKTKIIITNPTGVS